MCLKLQGNCFSQYLWIIFWKRQFYSLISEKLPIITIWDYSPKSGHACDSI